MPTAIEVNGLSKRYNGGWGLNDVSTAVPAGQVIGLLGHNGAGKTTLIKLLLGLIQPTKGEVRVLGSPVHAGTRREVHRQIGYLPESVAFYGNLTARETITYFARLKSRPVAEGVALLDLLGLTASVDKRVHTFSKGMRQRLGLAQALLGSPDVLLFDEPTAGLDPLAVLQFLELVRDLRTKGKTIVISSHLLAELEVHLDQAVVLSHGRIVAQGPLTEMRAALNLPIVVRARMSDDPQAALGEPVLAAQVVNRRFHDNAEVELEVSRHDKLDVIRRLVQLPDLVDISVKDPSLPEIYARISARPEPATGGRSA